VSIFDEGDGWRDLTDEGPGMMINSEKGGYSITQSTKPNAVIAVNKNGRTIASVNTKEMGKIFVDVLIERDKPKNTEVQKLSVFELEDRIVSAARELTTREAEASQHSVTSSSYMALAHRVLAIYYEQQHLSEEVSHS